MSKKRESKAAESATVAGWPKHELDQARYERDYYRAQLQCLQLAVEPFLRSGWAGAGWPDTVPLTLTVTAGDMRRLNMAGNGTAWNAVRLLALLGQAVNAMEAGTALWCARGAWYAGRWDGQQWAWGAAEIAAELALSTLKPADEETADEEDR